MKELRVYVINLEGITEDFYDEMQIDMLDDLDNDSFIETAEKQGGVYTIQGFQSAFNEEEVNTAVDVIRFIEVEV